MGLKGVVITRSMNVDTRTNISLSESMYRMNKEFSHSFHTSTLTFDIAQFFPSLNHQLLSKTLSKVGFNPKISKFFSSYLINRQTQYIWNYLISSFFKADIGVGQ